jgi:hypothetical protein
MIVVPETKKIEILLIEDDAGDIEIIKDNFENGPVPCHVSIARTTAKKPSVF